MDSREIMSIIQKEDSKEKPPYLYHYTSLEVLALILKNKTIRFNSIKNLDDTEESSLKYCSNNPPETYVSCWMAPSDRANELDESIPMWGLYTKMEDGIRIELPTYPFACPVEEVHNSVYGTYDYERAKMIPVLPQQRTDPEIVCMLQPNYHNYLCPVIYSDDILATDIQASTPDGPIVSTIHWGTIARFKRTVWSFQKEYRYIIMLQKTDKRMSLQPYYDAELRDDVIREMKIVVSPMFSEGNRALLEALLDKYNYGIEYKDSELKGKLKLK